MNVTNISLSTQNVWDAMQQETMRNSEQKTVTAPTGQEAAVTSVDPEDLDGDGVVTLLERIKAQKEKAANLGRSAKRAKPETEPASASETVATKLENVGPNAFERIRTNAGNAYLAQATNDVDDDDAKVLHKRA